MRTVILGMNSPIPGCLHPDIPGAAGERLFKMSGMTISEWETSFERRNLLPTKRWDREKATKSGPKVREKLKDRTVIVLGTEVWRALGLGSRPRHLSSSVISPEGSVFYFLPHPSGRNLFYNHEGNRMAARKLLRRLA